MESLLSELPEDDGEPVISVKTGTASPTPSLDRRVDARGPKYDAGLVYLLEFCTVLALRDADTIRAVGKTVADSLLGVLRTATEHHHILVSRAAFYLLQILRAGYVCSRPLHVPRMCSIPR